ncbi:MAG: hypothetical protein ACTSVV_06690 [Promethearchaeota archaeon]
MDILIEREIVKELIFFKLRYIQETINNILKKWGEENTDDFISKTRKGILENAEMDAISIRQLVADYNKLKKLLKSINSNNNE